MTATARRVAQLTQLHEDRATRVVVDEQPVLLVRQGDTVHALSADCPHAGAPLEEGALCNGHIVCPWHKGTFEITTGNVLEPPALAGLDRYPVTVENGEVMVTPEKIARHDSAENLADKPEFLVIGAGAAGAAACAALRMSGFAGKLTLLGDEDHEPYDRTALSKFVPSGEMPPNDVWPLMPAEWYVQQQIERINATVTELDVPAKAVRLADGRTLCYDTALLASGSHARMPPLPGHDLKGVHVLHNLRDAIGLCDAVESGKPVAVIGSSFIGLEVAAALRKRGNPVTVIAPEAIPFEKQFGEQFGTRIKQLHESNGVVFHLNEKVARLTGETAVQEVALESGKRVAASVVLIGVGVSPATGFIKGLPLQKDGGVLVNAGMQAAPCLYAAGDIAAFPLHENEEPLRIEHWRVAQQHAFIAAQNMCGARHRYAAVPYFWTYHYGKRFEYLGHASGWDDVLIDGDLASLKFLALYVKAGVTVAVLACEREAATARLIEAMPAGLSPDEALRLAKAAEAALVD
ncbi:FAD-dependent oxidoreductase [Paraburkholderia sp. DHOC27]|uniref:FAD-dependent oxidoreductase n=1 Tax=Paraburkholderia sp. DHOC27 TaxID=2303330 RepID=UPI000E3C56D4|nr:FAD-dependent oxidoreductase [Paraburkholderia sp. DHOC27]RFU48981.1 pyridine nucleotide-disulfide oxidoreductase [Paraburkholderia sp. DHOC27]